MLLSLVRVDPTMVLDLEFLVEMLNHVNLGKPVGTDFKRHRFFVREIVKRFVEDNFDEPTNIYTVLWGLLGN